MMEGRPRQNQAIHKSHGYAAEDTGFKCSEHATRGRAMQVKFFSIPAIQGRNNIRLAIDAESDVSEKARIQNCVNRVRVVRASAWQSDEIQCALFVSLTPRVYRDPVHFPSLAPIVRECLFETARIRSDVRYDKSNKDGPLVQSFL